MKEQLKKVIKKYLDETVLSLSPISGGDINQAYLVQLESGEKLFLKYNNASHAQDMFQAEAYALEVISKIPQEFRPLVPKVYLIEESFLLLEYLPPSSPTEAFYQELGRKLALLHQQNIGSEFGFSSDNYIGSNRQSNQKHKLWGEFFFQERLCFQVKMLTTPSKEQYFDRLEKMREKMVSFLEEYGPRPALVHGDLWSGNIYCSGKDRAYIVDPASYYGDREVDLAMSQLFGQFPQEFYQAYEDCYPLKEGFEKRKEIYNLYHLLNHLNLFGSGYLGAVENTLISLEKWLK